MAWLMSPAPACRSSCVSGRALARWEWSPPALSMAAGRGGSPIQWGAASPTATIRAAPATVAAAHAGLCRSTDAISDRLRCRVGVPVRAEDRDGLRCRADTRYTYGPSIGRAFALGGHPDAGPGLSCASGVRTPRGSGRRDHQQRWCSSRTLGAAVDSLHHKADAAPGIRAKWPKITRARRGPCRGEFLVASRAHPPRVGHWLARNTRSGPGGRPAVLPAAAPRDWGPVRLNLPASCPVLPVSHDDAGWCMASHTSGHPPASLVLA